MDDPLSKYKYYKYIVQSVDAAVVGMNSTEILELALRHESMCLTESVTYEMLTPRLLAHDLLFKKALEKEASEH